jgi:hypothetical protein
MPCHCRQADISVKALLVCAGERALAQINSTSTKMVGMRINCFTLCLRASVFAIIVHNKIEFFISEPVIVGQERIDFVE